MKRLLIITIIAIFLLTPSIRAGGKKQHLCKEVPAGYDTCKHHGHCYCKCCPRPVSVYFGIEIPCKWFDNEQSVGCQRLYQLKPTIQEALMVSALAEKQRDQIVQK